MFEVFGLDDLPDLHADDINWRWSTPQPDPPFNAELISILLAQRHEDRQTICGLQRQLDALREEIRRYTRRAQC